MPDVLEEIVPDVGAKTHTHICIYTPSVYSFLVFQCFTDRRSPGKTSCIIVFRVSPIGIDRKHCVHSFSVFRRRIGVHLKRCQYIFFQCFADKHSPKTLCTLLFNVSPTLGVHRKCCVSTRFLVFHQQALVTENISTRFLVFHQ